MRGFQVQPFIFCNPFFVKLWKFTEYCINDLIRVLIPIMRIPLYIQSRFEDHLNLTLAFCLRLALRTWSHQSGGLQDTCMNLLPLNFISLHRQVVLCYLMSPLIWFHFPNIFKTLYNPRRWSHTPSCSLPMIWIC